MTEDVTAWQCDWDVVTGERLRTDDANFGRRKSLVDKGLHIACG